MSCSLNLTNLTKDNLFVDINLHLGHKEKIAIIGDNGCGKSTLLDIIAGLSEAKYDSLEIFHHHIHNLGDYKIVRDKIGYLFQDSNDQFIAPTVLEDIAFGLLAKGTTQDEAIKQSLDILAEFGLSDIKNNSIFELSGGEKKIVALLSILVTKPKLMLLDEPTNNLDIQTQTKVINILKQIDTSMIIVSHQNDFIYSIVDKVYKIEDKRLRV